MNLERTLNKHVVTIRPDATVLEAAKLMQSNCVSSLIVLEAAEPIGVITEKDILNVVANENKPEKMSVGMVMTSGPKIIKLAYDVLERIRLMHEIAHTRDTDNHQWLVDCPFTGTLAATFIRPRELPLSRLIEIRSCSLRRERQYCGQRCVQDKPANSWHGVA